MADHTDKSAKNSLSRKWLQLKRSFRSEWSVILAPDNDSKRTTFYVPFPGEAERRMHATDALCTAPRHRYVVRQVVLHKGQGLKALGFSIVGGADSPRGHMPILVGRVFPDGQAAENDALRAGDEILSVNGEPLKTATHQQAVAAFRRIRSGPVHLLVAAVVPLKTRRPIPFDCN